MPANRSSATSILTDRLQLGPPRLPAPQRQSVESAFRLIASEFPEPHFLQPHQQRALPAEFARAGAAGVRTVSL